MYQATDVFSDETRAAIIALAARYQRDTGMSLSDQPAARGQGRSYQQTWPATHPYHQHQHSALSTPPVPHLQCPQAPVSPPPKRRRINYSKYQEELLLAIIARVRYPNTMQKQVIAKRVGISRHQVKVWFQNRRRKDVISGKKESGGDSPGSSSDDPETRAPSVVPASVLTSILDEMNYYGADDFKSSKNARRKMADHRHKPYTVVSPPPVNNLPQEHICSQDSELVYRRHHPVPNEGQVSSPYSSYAGQSHGYTDDAPCPPAPISFQGHFYPITSQNLDPITSQASYASASNHTAPFHYRYPSATHDPSMQLFGH